MSKNTSIVTVFSGFLGGSTQAVQEASSVHFSEPFNLAKVIVAAVVSACVGYAVKLVLDRLVNVLKKHNRCK